MDRDTALQIAQEYYPQENRRGLLDILFEQTMYPAYDPDVNDHEPLLRQELETYRPRYEEKQARKADQAVMVVGENNEH
jgi:hypothetical protein